MEVLGAPSGRETRHRRLPHRDSGAAFFVVSALLFAVSATVTIVSAASMSAMGGMPMPGGWTMSMVWMRLPGQTLPGAAMSFLVMWVVMMMAMMLPSLVPMLSRYRAAVGSTAATLLGLRTTLVGAGYFFVWAVAGLAVFSLGAALATMAMRYPALARVTPVAAGLVILMAGAFQLTRWKAHHLDCCRQVPRGGEVLAVGLHDAWRHGVRLGVHCGRASGGLMAVLLVLGVMDLRAMAVIATAITVERVAPAGARVARATGVVGAGAGLLLMLRAAVLG